MPLSKQEAGQARIALSLPDAIAKALLSYHLFMQKEISEDPKEFAAHHTAAKVAIAHVELLLKLGKSLDAVHEDEALADGERARLEALLEEASQDVARYKSRQDVWEEEGEEGE
ncbi:MAG: hypothetical protein AB7E85_01970 [Pseudobdellovibrionaceae bacterium]